MILNEELRNTLACDGLPILVLEGICERSDDVGTEVLGLLMA